MLIMIRAPCRKADVLVKVWLSELVERIASELDCISFPFDHLQTA